MNNHERYPTPESNVPAHGKGFTLWERSTKRKPGDWLPGALMDDISMSQIFFPQESPALDREVEEIEFFDALYRDYPELRPQRKKR